MKRLRIFAGLALVFLASSLFAADLDPKVGPLRTIYPIAAISNAYLSSQMMDLRDYHGATILLTAGPVFDAGVTISLKYQWSDDNVNWTDGRVLITGTASATEQPYSVLTRVVQGLCTNGFTYAENVDRVKKYFRVQVKGSASTTGQVSVSAATISK